MQKNSTLKGCLMAALASAALPAIAWAQEASPGAAKDAAAASQEIVVTAQKRSESIYSVPITINAYSQEKLDQQGVKNIADLSRVTPGLTFRTNNTFDNPTLAIRGVLSIVGAATTGVYIDETPVTARSVCFYCGSSAFPQLFDLERIEVLKGPQGTLFGAGSEGGTVRFITPQPSLDEVTGYGRAELATTRFGEASYEAGLALGAPIVTDKLGFRVSAWGRKDGGYIDRVDRVTGATLDKNINNLKSYVVRASLAAKPVERLTITPSFYYQRNKTDGRNFFMDDQGLFLSNRVIAEPGSDRQTIASLKAEFEADGATITSVTSYYDRRQKRIDDYSEIEAIIYSGGAVSFLPGYVAQNELETTQKNWTQELRAASTGDGPLSWTIGLYYANNRSTLDQGIRQDLDDLTVPLYGVPAVFVFGVPQVGPFSFVDHQTQRDTELAIFGQGSYELTDSLKLSLGARYSHIKFKTALDRSGLEAGGDVSVGSSQKSHPFTPKATLSYQAGPTLLYATAAKGFRIGGGNTSVREVGICQNDLQALGIDDVPNSYGSDSVWSYEAGVKSRFADGRGRIAGSVFQIDWKDIQSQVLLPTCLYDYTDNLGKARSRGFELDATIELIDGLSLYGQLSYTDAKFIKDIESGSLQLVTAGQSLPLSAWTVSAGSEYEFTVSGDLNAYLRGDYQYSSAFDRDHPNNNSYDPITNRSPAIHLVSARAGVRTDSLDFSVFVNNLFDVRTDILLTRDGQFSNAFRRSVVRPRTIGATVTKRF